MANVGKVQTPGAPDADAAYADADADADADAETVTISKSDLASLMGRIAVIESRTAAPPLGRAEAQAALPDQTEIDPAAIKIAVLSRQGWVLPLAPVANAGKV
jgi:hypothetical protein